MACSFDRRAESRPLPEDRALDGDDRDPRQGLPETDRERQSLGKAEPVTRQAGELGGERSVGKIVAVQGAGRCAGARRVDRHQARSDGESVEHLGELPSCPAEDDAGGQAAGRRAIEQVGDEKSGAVVLAPLVAEGQDDGARCSGGGARGGGSHSRAIRSFRKCVAHEMQGS